MTAPQFAELLVDLTRELSERTRERDAWRLVAVAGVHHSHGQHVELKRLEDRYHRFLREQRGIGREVAERDTVEDAPAGDERGEVAA